jgi:hypothetical protein
LLGIDEIRPRAGGGKKRFVVGVRFRPATDAAQGRPHTHRHQHGHIFPIAA